MSKILILYSTTDGHTRDICRRIGQVIEQQGPSVTLASIADNPGIDPAAFDRIMIGASVRYGRHSPLIVDFINRHAKTPGDETQRLVFRQPRRAQAGEAATRQ